MDPQDKKKKDWSLFGKQEDRAIATAKYKREMGINPIYKTEQNAEVSRRAQSMKNPTDRPYDVSTSKMAVVKVVPNKTSVNKFEASKNNPVRKAKFNSGYVPWVVGAIKDAPKAPELKRKPARTYTKPYDVKESKNKSVQSAGLKVDREPVGNSSGKMTSFQRMKARQFEKEGVAGRSMTRAAAQKKAVEKVGDSFGFKMPKVSLAIIGISKKKLADKPVYAGKTKSQLAAEFRAKQQGLRKK